MKSKLKLLISFFALCQMMIEVIDELRGTSAFNHLLKNLCNKVSKECEKEIKRLYEALNEDSEKYFYQTVDMVETMILVIKEKDLDLFIQLLKDFREGNVCIVDDNKHKKMLNQMETI